MRDYALARELAAADHLTLDDDVLFAAAYLHDLAAFKPWEDEKLDHSDVAAGIVDTVLKGTGFPMAKIDAVRGAIRTHMYYRDPVGPEALYLHDADALDWLGAIGVARVMALVDPNGADPNGPAQVKMLEDNLKDVPARPAQSRAVISVIGRAALDTAPPAGNRLPHRQVCPELRRRVQRDESACHGESHAAHSARNQHRSRCCP